MSDPSRSPVESVVADPVPAEWFREPTRREHRIAAGLFIGFAGFFAMLFVVLDGWWFRWVILALGAWSLVYALGHARDAWRRGGIGRGAGPGTAGEAEGASS
jgi:hypothetical protein